MSDVTRISHWIDGKPYGAVAERTGEVRDPATGALSGRVDFATPEVMDEAVAAAKAAFAEWGTTSLTKRAGDPVRLPPAAQRAQGGARRDHHRRARQGALRRARRGDSRARGRRVRLRDAAPAQGRLLRGRLDRCRRLLDPSAARRRRHHLAVQLPGDGADVVLPRRHRRGQHRHRQAEREGPVGDELHRRAVGRGGSARTACSTSCTATRWRSTRCSTTRTSRASRSSGRPRSRSTSTRRGTANGKRVQALGGAKNHMVVLPDADLDLAADAAVNAGFGSAGERCMAISALVCVGDVADPLVAKIGERMATLRTGDGRRGCDMGPLVTAVHRDKVRSYVDAGEAAGRDARRRRARPRGRRRARRLLARAHAHRPRHHRHERLHRRDLRPGAVRRARRLLRRGAAPGQRPPVRQRHRHLHQRRRGRPALPERGRGRDGRHQRADPGAHGLLLLRRLEELAVRRHATRTAPRACTSSPAARWSPVAGSTPATAASTSGSRPTAERADLRPRPAPGRGLSRGYGGCGRMRPDRSRPRVTLRCSLDSPA